MSVHSLAVLIAVLSQPLDSSESGTAWQTSDGAVAVTIPKGFQLVPMKANSTTGVIGSRWKDENGSAFIQAYQRPINPRRVNKPISLKRLLKIRTDEWTVESQGRLLHSSTETVQGFPLFSLTVSLDNSIVKERVVVTANAIYIVGTMAAAKTHEDDARLQQFLQSLKIQSLAVPPLLSQPGEWDSDTLNELSGKIGFYGIVVLFVCGIVTYEKRRKAKVAKSEQPPSDLQSGEPNKEE